MNVKNCAMDLRWLVDLLTRISKDETVQLRNIQSWSQHSRDDKSRQREQSARSKTVVHEEFEYTASFTQRNWRLPKKISFSESHAGMKLQSVSSELGQIMKIWNNIIVSRQHVRAHSTFFFFTFIRVRVVTLLSLDIQMSRTCKQTSRDIQYPLAFFHFHLRSKIN